MSEIKEKTGLASKRGGPPNWKSLASRYNSSLASLDCLVASHSLGGFSILEVDCRCVTLVKSKHKCNS